MNPNQTDLTFIVFTLDFQKIHIFLYCLIHEEGKFRVFNYSDKQPIIQDARDFDTWDEVYKFIESILKENNFMDNEHSKDFPPEDYENFNEILSLPEDLAEIGAFIKGQDDGKNPPRLILGIIIQPDTGDTALCMKTANNDTYRNEKLTAEMINNEFKLFDYGIEHLQQCKQQLADYVKEKYPSLKDRLTEVTKKRRKTNGEGERRVILLFLLSKSNNV